MYEAFETYQKACKASGARRKMRLAYETLAQWPECPHAYLLLADLVPDLDLAESYLIEAFHAGQHLAKVDWNPFSGEAEIVGFGTTPPELAAMRKLATLRCGQGQFAGAIKVLEALLERNWADPLEVRHWLIALHLAVDTKEARSRVYQLTSLYRMIDEPDYQPEDEDHRPVEGHLGITDAQPRAAWWLYNVAIHTYRVSGPADRNAKAWISEACEANPSVVVFLAGNINELDDVVELAGQIGNTFNYYANLEAGTNGEAMEYIHFATPAWKDRPGTREWLVWHADRDDL